MATIFILFWILGAFLVYDGIKENHKDEPLDYNMVAIVSSFSWITIIVCIIKDLVEIWRK